ncbi:MAG: hypothetical protein ACRDMV_14855 [Streptosporangiales bacterium]
MAVLRRLAAGAAVAAFATLGFASAANASVTDGLNGLNSLSGQNEHHMQWYGVGDDGGLVSLSDNNVGPFQACHNNVPVNVVGGQVPISDIVGVLGIGSDGNWATQVHNCDQTTAQNNGDEWRADPGSEHWYRVGDDGGLVAVDENNVGPVQGCDNNVPVNVVGGQVPVDDVTGIIGIGSDGNTANLLNNCSQDTAQDN